MISLESYPFWRYGYQLVQYNQYSYPNIEANIFEARLKRAAVGSSCNLFVVISKNFSSMSPIDRGCPSLPL